MLSKLVSQVVVFGTPLIMVCLFIAFIGLFIYFNRRIDRVVDRVNTLSELVSVLQDIVNTRPQQKQEVFVQPKEDEPNKVVHVPEQSDKIVVSDDEEDYVSSSEEEDEEEDDHNVNLTINENDVEDAEPLITITKVEHSQPIENDYVSDIEEVGDVEIEEVGDVEIEQVGDVEIEEVGDVEIEEVGDVEIEQVGDVDEQPGLIDDDMISVVSMSAATVIPEPHLEEICTNAVLKERFLSTNYRGYKVNQLRDLATDLHLIKDKDAAKLKKGELLTFLDKTYVNLKN